MKKHLVIFLLFVLVTSAAWGTKPYAVKTAPVTVEKLIAMLSDNYYGVRMNAAEALGRIRPARAVKPLIRALDDDSALVREDAAGALKKYRSAEAVALLIKAGRNENSRIRKVAIRILGEIKPPQATAPIILALKDKDKSVRLNAARALGKIGSLEAVAPLLITLSDADNQVRVESATALGVLRSPRAVDPLIKALNREDWILKESAAWALGELRAAKAIKPLIAAIQSKNQHVAGSAAVALGKIGEPAVKHLIPFLKTGVLRIRCAIAQALGRTRSDLAVPPLVEALKDQYWVRDYAVHSLQMIGSKVAIDHLIDALKNKNSDIRAAAASVLGSIKAVKAISHLTQALNDKDGEVRKNAAHALGKILADDNNAEEKIMAEIKHVTILFSRGKLNVKTLLGTIHSLKNRDFHLVDHSPENYKPQPLKKKRSLDDKKLSLETDNYRMVFYYRSYIEKQRDQLPDAVYFYFDKINGLPISSLVKTFGPWVYYNYEGRQKRLRFQYQAEQLHSPPGRKVALRVRGIIRTKGGKNIFDDKVDRVQLKAMRSTATP